MKNILKEALILRFIAYKVTTSQTFTEVNTGAEALV